MIKWEKITEENIKKFNEVKSLRPGSCLVITKHGQIMQGRCVKGNFYWDYDYACLYAKNVEYFKNNDFIGIAKVNLMNP